MSKALLEEYEQKLAQNPSSVEFVDWAQALLDSRQHAQALDVVRQGLRQHPTMAKAYAVLGDIHLALGQQAEALQAFEDAVSLEPENPEVYLRVCESLCRQKIFRQALPYLKKAVTLQPNNGKMRQWLDEAQKQLADSRASASLDFDKTLPSPFEAVGAKPSAATNDSEQTVVFIPTAEEKAILERATNPFDVVAEKSTWPSARTPTGEMTIAFDTLGLTSPEEQTVIPPQDASIEKEASGGPKVHSNLLADVPSLISNSPSGLGQDRFPAPPDTQPDVLSFLNDVPTLQPNTTQGAPRSAYNTQTIEAVAKDYESDLRRQLAEQAAKRTFLQKHGTWMLGTALFLALVGAFALAYWRTGAVHRGLDLADHVALAKKSIAEDTASSYRKSIVSLEAALKMDEGNAEALAWLAYAQALLFAEFGGADSDRQRAIAALEHAQVREAYPGLSLASAFYLSVPSQQAKLKPDILANKFDQAELEELAGRLLLADNKIDEALKRLARAIELKAGNVRAFVALGKYYLQYQDAENALKFFDGPAAEMSRSHVERTLGAAEARLRLGRDEALALEEVEGLPEEKLLPAVTARKLLVKGKLLSATAQHDKALTLLREGAQQYHAEAFDFYMAWGQAARKAGRMADARSAFNMAMTNQPDSEEAKEALARTLVAQGKEREALQLPGNSRRMALVRGLAYVQLKDWKKAIVELHRTQEKEKFPPEAYVYMALADGFENDAGKAVENLEKLLASSKPRADAWVALGTLQWKRGETTRAEEAFTQAAKDASTYEGNCSLGRLLLERNLPELALPPLMKAIALNDSHDEAHQALQKVFDAIGRYSESLRPAKQWVDAHPDSLEAQMAYVKALYRNGQFEEAEAASNGLTRPGASNVKVHRLRAQVLFARSDTPKAFRALEKANSLDSTDAETFCEIAMAFVRAGSKEKAAVAFATAVKNQAQSHCGAVGMLWQKLPATPSQVVRELRELVKTAANADDKAFAQSALAWALLAAGDKKEAKEAAQAAVTLTPFSGHAQWVLAQVALKLKEEKMAMEALEKAVTYEPVSSPVLLAYADVFSRGKDKLRLAKAVHAYETFLALGGAEAEIARVKKDLPQLKKRLE